MKIVIKKRSPEEIKLFYMRNLYKVKFTEKPKKKIETKSESIVKVEKKKK
jgi:hypothetical protein